MAILAWMSLPAGGWLALGCQPPAVSPTRDAGEPVASIHVVSHGWHAGLIVRRGDIPDDVWPEKADFPHADYLEVGWGERDYYQTRNPGPGKAIKAVLWPNPSVLHVVGLRGPVTGHFPGQRIIALRVTHAGLARLLAYIDAAHDRPAHAVAARLGPGLYGDSYYYAARGRFHLFINCNVWIARALRAAGHDVHDSLTVGGLFEQLEADGRVPGGRPEP